ncbi:MAG: hypothetical protein RR361_08245, partial [Anaerovorax sp.]
MADLALFETILKKNQAALKKWLGRQLKDMGYKPTSKTGFLYAAGTHPVLLVAHMDTVHRRLPSDIFYTADFTKAMAQEGIGGDDRCGVYIILKLIKQLKCHVLFCEDEEAGGIGASRFAKSGIVPDVNYIVEFDRGNANDAVFYYCDNRDFTAFVTGFNFLEDWGSFSDISILAPALGIAAVNISCGYYEAHTTSEFVILPQMEATI